MKTWTSIITAGAILAFAVPAGNAAVPNDGGTVYGPRGGQVTKLVKTSAALKGAKHKHDARVMGGSTYNPYAYAPGGVSPAVAYAIQTRGKKGMK